MKDNATSQRFPKYKKFNYIAINRCNIKFSTKDATVINQHKHINNEKTVVEYSVRK